MFLIFLLLFFTFWGIGILISFLASKTTFPLPSVHMQNVDRTQQETLHDFSEKAKTQQEDFIEEQEFQVEQQRRMMGMPPSSDGRYFWYHSFLVYLLLLF